jgi:molybdate transport system substrate-binding protein
LTASLGNSASLRDAFAIGLHALRQFIVAIRHHRELSRLVDREDHMLADIGLAREDLHAALAEPFWRDPTAGLARRAGELRRRKAVARLVSRVGVSALLIIAAWGATPTSAAEIRLLSAAAMQSVLKEIVADFERTSGHKLVIDYATMGAINQRVLAGETADLVIGSGASVSGLVKEGKIQADTQITICKVGAGIVVPSGTPKPQVGSIDEFKRALLAAKVIVYADPTRGGAAGIHIARVIEKLGLAEQLKAKTRFGAGGDVTEVTIAQGVGALGMTQISEIVEKPGADFVGPLPAELQNYTGVAAGVPVGIARSEAVASFLAYLKGPTAIAVMKTKGMEVD